MATSWTTFPSASTKPKSGAVDDNALPNFFGTTVDGPLAVTRLSRTPGADPAIYQQFIDAMGLRDTLQKTTADYTGAVNATQPTAEANTKQDLGELSQIFSPNGYQTSLQSIRDRKAAAIANLQKYLLGDTKRALSLGRIGGGGGGGLNTYLARIAAGEAGKIRANAATDAATQERTDAAALMGARGAAIGKSNGLIDQLLARLLSPADVATKANATFGDTLSRAIAAALQNSMTGVGTRVG